MNPARRSAWFTPLLVAAITGYAASRVWGPSEGSRIASGLLWLICVCSAWVSLQGMRCALELRSLRRRASRSVVPFNEARFDLLVSAEQPDATAILEESRRLRAELDRNEARRRLMLLEAGVDACGLNDHGHSP